VLQYPFVVIREVVVLVVLQRPVHDFQQLLLARIVNLPDLGLNLVEPVFYGVELRGVGRQVEDVHAYLSTQVDGLFLVVDGAVVEHEPLLPLVFLGSAFFLGQLLFLLLHPREELLYEIQIFVFAVCALDDAPVGQSVIRDYGDQGETLALGDGAVYGDFFVGAGPSLIAGHVEVKTAFV
jgi:hypothetical protein